ncbi:hypothetical protein MKX08_007862 [Trichoderma sp. CBMAI-0020]|nr:hypothetical protein MKX08_007862 [Trichoderma sp. CBMAI-0020]
MVSSTRPLPDRRCWLDELVHDAAPGGREYTALHLRKKPECSSKKYRIKLITGLVLPYFLASLDMTVVTALPLIASFFYEFYQLKWIVTAYTLTSTAFIPFYGQLADVFGRQVPLQAVR